MDKKYTLQFAMDVIIHTYPNDDGGIINPPLKLEHGLILHPSVFRM